MAQPWDAMLKHPLFTAFNDFVVHCTWATDLYWPDLFQCFLAVQASGHADIQLKI